MNTVAKVFVVLNLVFSLIYVGVAATLLGKQENWKQKAFEEEKGRADDNKKSAKELANRESQITGLRGEVETFRSGNDNYKALLEAQTNENKNLEKKWNELMTEVQVLKANNEKLTGNLSEMGRQKDELSKALEQKTAELGDALKVRDQSVDDHQRVKEQLKDMNVSILDLKQRHVDLAKKKAELEWILARVQEEYHITLTDVWPPVPKIDGRVVGVSNKINLVVISVGEEDGVKVGFEFTIYRGNTYVGKMVVEKVYPRQAAGHVVLEKTKDKVQPGDSVTTQVF